MSFPSICTVFLLATGTALAMYDAILPQNDPPSSCEHGCALWADLEADGNTRDQSDVNSKFSAGEVPPEVGRSCAMPANDPDFGDGWCYCRKSNDASWGLCSPPPGNIPSQMSVMVISNTEAVIVFATQFDGKNETKRAKWVNRTREGVPVVEISPAVGKVEGWVQTPSKGTATNRLFHYVYLGGLSSKVVYRYRVKASNETSIWSEWATFRALPPISSQTTFAIWGDMGVFSWNNMDSIIRHFDNSEIDFAGHIGDHGYNIGVEARGDGYFDGNQGMYTRGLWVPGIGNHEFYDDDQFNRYDTYTSGIGRYGNSGSSKYYSVDIGYMHLIVLDSTSYFQQPGSDTKLQLQWLENDLKQVNRSATPWIFMTAHHPLYCSSITTFDDHTNTQHIGSGYNPDAFEGCVGSGEEDVAAMRADWEPLMMKYGVDVYMCGHEHNYESIFPVSNNTLRQTDFENPVAPVHVVSGAGGAPELDLFGVPGPWTRKQINNAWSYSLVSIPDPNTLVWQQWYNSYYGGKLADTFTITQKQHGPFNY